MNTRRLRLLSLVAALGLTVSALAQTSVSVAEVKKLTDRYALTRTRIEGLLGRRKQPVPLPTTSLPNPFYIPLAAEAGKTPAAQTQEEEQPVLPAAADESDADTLARHANALRLAGYFVFNGLPHITINGAISKVGDVVTVGTKDKPVYLHIVAITPQDVTFRLNEVTQVIPLRK